jgi:hypothetical protein
MLLAITARNAAESRYNEASGVYPIGVQVKQDGVDMTIYEAAGAELRIDQIVREAKEGKR